MTLPSWKSKAFIRWARLCLALLMMGFFSSLPAQKALQFEKAGSFNTIKFFIGDLLVYKIKSDRKHWLKETIQEIHIEERLVEFENRVISVDSIFAIQIRSGGNFVRNISRALISFSGIWTFWTGVSLAYGDSLAWSTVIIGVGSFALGQFVKLAFFKTHRLKETKRLRLIDLTFYQRQTPKRT